MEALVDEREANGPFASLEDFAARIDPRLLNRRQIESLAARGRVRLHQARPRGGVRRRRDHPRPRGERRTSSATSGQAGLFGGELQPRPRRSACRATLMDAGAAHGRRARRVRLLFLGPSGRCARSICSPRTRSRRFAELADVPHAAEGERVGATMAALVEEARWRTSAKGRRYMMATLSDRSGQFSPPRSTTRPARRSKRRRKRAAAGC